MMTVWISRPWASHRTGLDTNLDCPADVKRIGGWYLNIYLLGWGLRLGGAA